MKTPPGSNKRDWMVWPLLGCLPMLAGFAGAAPPADWYHSEGPLRGSLKSDAPLPIYDADPQHLWNRLFAAFYIRPSALPSRPEYPQDSTKLDEWERKLRAGQLPPGPVVKRFEGGDVSTFPAWAKTRHYSDPAVVDRANKLLDEFLQTRAERLVADPLKRAFMQRDLWSVFDHLDGQNIARFGDADLARRRAAAKEYEVEPEEWQRGDPAAMERREMLCRKLAIIIKRLALPKAAIEALPDNYAAAVRSGQFAGRHDFESESNYLPPGLLTQPGEWVEVDKPQIPWITWSIRGRSYYRIFWRFPEGRPAVEGYLAYLAREGVDWQQSAAKGSFTLKPNVRQIPAGTEAAIVQFMVLLDDQLNLVPTRVVELVNLCVFKNVTGARDPQTNSGRGEIFRQYVVRRALLFDNLNQGGLHRMPDDAPTYRVLINAPKDWGQYGRQQSVAQTCLHCHMHAPATVGVFSLNSISCHFPGSGLSGFLVAIGAKGTHAISAADRTVRWKVGEEDYLRLVEHARAEPATAHSEP